MTSPHEAFSRARISYPAESEARKNFGGLVAFAQERLHGGQAYLLHERGPKGAVRGLEFSLEHGLAAIPSRYQSFRIERGSVGFRDSSANVSFAVDEDPAVLSAGGYPFQAVDRGIRVIAENELVRTEAKITRDGEMVLESSVREKRAVPPTIEDGKVIYDNGAVRIEIAGAELTHNGEEWQAIAETKGRVYHLAVESNGKANFVILDLSRLQQAPPPITEKAVRIAANKRRE